MSVELDYPHTVSIWDYEALIQEELGEYLTATPATATSSMSRWTDSP